LEGDRDEGVDGGFFIYAVSWLAGDYFQRRFLWVCNSGSCCFFPRCGLGPWWDGRRGACRDRVGGGSGMDRLKYHGRKARKQRICWRFKKQPAVAPRASVKELVFVTKVERGR